jgi:hypothetical protein
MTDLMWADTHDGVSTPPGPLLIRVSRLLRARSRELGERYQRVYDESDALEARYEELRELFETARALYEMRMALSPGSGDPWLT